MPGNTITDRQKSTILEQYDLIVFGQKNIEFGTIAMWAVDGSLDCQQGIFLIFSYKAMVGKNKRKLFHIFYFIYLDNNQR
jgi:hypothetical protein